MATYSYYEGDSDDIVWKLAGTRYTGYCGVGESVGGENEGAVRFVNVTIPQGKTIASATLHLKITTKGDSPVKLRITGIDEDNVSDFNDDPFVKNQTSAVGEFEASLGSVGDFQNFSVTSQVQETVNRGSWSSGNAMGFHIWENGSDSGHYFWNSSLDDYLEVTFEVPSASPSESKSGSKSLSPSASVSPSASLSPSRSVSPSPAPIFKKGVLKIGKQGVNVLTNSDVDNFIFHSDYGTLKYYVSGTKQITIIGDGSDLSTTETIAHNLGYTPFFIVYSEGPTTEYIQNVPWISRTLTTAQETHAWADSNNLYVKLRNKKVETITRNFYYKIFKNNTGL